MPLLYWSSAKGGNILLVEKLLVKYLCFWNSSCPCSIGPGREEIPSCPISCESQFCIFLPKTIGGRDLAQLQINSFWSPKMYLWLAKISKAKNKCSSNFLAGKVLAWWEFWDLETPRKIQLGQEIWDKKQPHCGCVSQELGPPHGSWDPFCAAKFGKTQGIWLSLGVGGSYVSDRTKSWNANCLQRCKDRPPKFSKWTKLWHQCHETKMVEKILPAQLTRVLEKNLCFRPQTNWTDVAWSSSLITNVPPLFNLTRDPDQLIISLVTGSRKVYTITTRLRLP